jgi:hypothetical protein
MVCTTYVRVPDRVLTMITMKYKRGVVMYIRMDTVGDGNSRSWGEGLFTYLGMCVSDITLDHGWVVRSSARIGKFVGKGVVG